MLNKENNLQCYLEKKKLNITFKTAKFVKNKYAWRIL